MASVYTVGSVRLSDDRFTGLPPSRSRPSRRSLANFAMPASFDADVCSVETGDVDAVVEAGDVDAVVEAGDVDGVSDSDSFFTTADLIHRLGSLE